MLNKLTKKPILFYVAAFMIPLVVIMIALIGLRITPFGNHTLIISDAKGLYVNYLSYAGRLFQGLEGFVYSFEKGLGGNMMPHMAGTMLNPLFALMGLFRISDYPLAFTIISTLNFTVSGLTMYILLADLFGHKRSNLIFSTSYALSGFLVANVFQIIFFAGVHVLPLMVLGLRKIFRGGNPLLYIAAMIYAMLGSFYFGFTLFVASLLFFFVYLWLRKEELIGKRLSIFLNYGFSSLLAGLVPILVWLPGYLGIMGGRADQTQLTDFSFWEKMPFVEIFSKLFTGTNTTEQLKDGLPNIFVGLLPVALVILFFINKKITRRIKAAAGIVLGFYLLGFFIIAVDMILHGGTNTNWFNFRYSYIFSFVLLVIAAYEWQYVDELTTKDLKACFIGLVIAALLIFSKKYEYVSGGEVLLDFVLLLVIFLAYWLYKKRPKFNPKHTFEALVLFVVCISLFLNYTICTKNIREWELSVKDFKQTVEAVDPLVSSIKRADTDFYRMEVNHQLTQTCGNDPMLYGYYGVGHGGSNERDFVRQELFKFGVPWYNMRNYYSQGVPAATDTLLGIRYLIADEDLSAEKNYQRITDMKSMGLDFGDSVVYDSFINEYALPIGFISENAVNEIELTNDDLFDNLNRVWKAISGENKSVFIEEDDIAFKTKNLSASAELTAEDARKILQEIEEKSKTDNASDEKEKNVAENTNVGDSTDSGKTSDNATEFHIIKDEPPMFASSIEFRFTASRDGQVYVYHGGALVDNNGNAESLVKYMGYYHKGDIVKGYLSVPQDYVNRITFEEYAGRFRAAYADMDALQSLSTTITERPSTIEKIKENQLKGTMTVKAGQELLFTIPWDEGWTLYVDGKKTELTKVLGVFMAAKASPGKHTYEMVYEPGGLSLAIKVSIGAIIVLVLYLAFGRRLINKLPVRKKKTRDGEETEEPETPEKEETHAEVKQSDSV